MRNKAVFENVQTYLLNNFGATTSLNNILKDLEKQGVHIKRETLNRYIKILQDAKILYRCNRFDLKSRRSLAGGAEVLSGRLRFLLCHEHGQPH